MSVNSEMDQQTTYYTVLKGLLTASTRFTTDLAKFLVCCLVLCRLYCTYKEKQRYTCISCNDLMMLAQHANRQFQNLL